MLLIAFTYLLTKAIRMSNAKFYCNKLTTVQGIQYYVSLIFSGHSVVGIHVGPLPNSHLMHCRSE